MIHFSSEHLLFQESVRKFVEQELRPRVLGYEEQGFTDRWVWERCGALGFLGVPYSKAYGGLEADYTYSYILAEELAKCGSPGVALGIAVQTDMATPALAKYGNHELKQEFLTQAIAGTMIGSIAVSEPDGGSDVASLKTKAVLEGESYLISGRKTFITNGTHSDFLTLLARTSDEPGYHSFSLFIVPTQSPGVHISKKLSKTCYPSSDTVEISLENVRVPKYYLIGEAGEGFIYQMQQFQFERLAASFQMIGGMKHCYELTKSYSQQRSAFGKPLARMQVTRHKLAQMIAEITTVDALAKECVELVNQKKDFTKHTAMLKLIAAQTQQRVLEECVQIHGGYGLMQEYDVARYFRDSKLAGIGGGSNEIMKEIIAKTEEI